jgi:NADH-quinone oxidoreductase subunit L
MISVESSLAYIILLPLLGSAAAFLIGRKNKNLAGWIATLAAASSFGIVLNLFSRLGKGDTFEYNLFNWFTAGTFSVDFMLRFDALTAVMCLVITGVGSLIHLYSISYMSEDEGKHRFFSYLNLFLFSMLVLVLGGNLLVLFIGWEGVGLCSYLLIGFWFKNLAYAAAGRKAFVVNRIGDAGFLLAIFLVFQQFGTIDFVELAKAIGAISDFQSYIPVFTLIGICLFIGAAGKSAQIPLYVWLPDAMAGPTPVSALIHAATMVTAGVYMMARANFIFEHAPYAMAVVIVISVLTAFIAGTTAIAQNDIKKVLAYSTVSQLGFMFMAAGSGAYWVAIFHVVTHAFFKACLFLGAGSVIHGCHHEQDMRHMGGLAKLMPVTFVTYLLSTLAIAGIAPFSGYWSKHAILAALGENANPHLLGIVEYAVILASITAVVTAFYMTRSLAMTFLGEYRGHEHPHESPVLMTAPLVILATLATVAGYYGGDLAHYLEGVLPNGPHFHKESLGAALAHSWTAVLGVVVALVLYTKLSEVPGKIYKALSPIGKLLSNKYYLDEIFGALIVRPLESLARMLWIKVDQGIVDGTVNGTAAVVDVSGEVVRSFQTGQIRTYMVMMFLGMVVLMSLYLAL